MEIERARLDGIQETALANGVPGVRIIGAEELRELEPHVRGVAALHSPSTSIVGLRRGDAGARQRTRSPTGRRSCSP
jgi:L-2-hydroxyglutarate oxidase LhgO